jgi:hypothetical protein
MLLIRKWRAEEYDTYHILVLVLEGVFADVVAELFAVVDDDDFLLENLDQLDITIL